MEILIVTLLAVVVILQIVSLFLKKDGGFSDAKRDIIEENRANIRTLGEIITTNQKNTDDMQTGRFAELTKNLTDRQGDMNKAVSDSIGKMEERLKSLEETNRTTLFAMREGIEKRLDVIRDDNNKKLEKMQQTVDEKLQKTLEDKMDKSFKLVSERLEQVYKGLGEMQTVAAGVGDLKKVLSNVKTRGILGEIQLGAILREILSPEQYEENTATKPNSKNVVEFAVKMPVEEGGFIYLPIDSKFPADAYTALKDAYDSGDSDKIQSARSIMMSRMKSFAKDIHEKYVEVPYTTEFAIMFLPFEGLYAEAVNCGMVEILQREYRINIAGPSTMAALLNSLQMGFKTVAIQKRSMEVWTVLGAVKSEFDKFEKILSATQQRINQANTELDKLVGVRTRAIQRKLRDVEKIDDKKTDEILADEYGESE